MDKYITEILVVEDNPYEADLVKRCLKKLLPPERIAHIEDGAQALDFIFARGDYAFREGAGLPRLILLDIKLPKVTGLEILAQIRANAATQQVPVVVFSSSREMRDLTEAYKYGANSYVVKPIDFGELENVITSIVRYWLEINYFQINNAGTTDKH
ncbi:MAG: response regulator [Chitinophagales bacterium]